MACGLRDNSGYLFASRLLLVGVGVARPAANVGVTRWRFLCDYVHARLSNHLGFDHRRAMTGVTLLRDQRM